MKSFDKDKMKKQIVSGGIYIALAAAVVTVTLNGVNNIIGSSEDYEIPEIKLDLFYFLQLLIYPFVSLYNTFPWLIT